MTRTRGAVCAAVSEGAGCSGIASSVPHDEQDGHLPVFVVVMCPQAVQIYLVILLFAIIYNFTIHKKFQRGNHFARNRKDSHEEQR